jgi:surfeit locus 1 family protein
MRRIPLVATLIVLAAVAVMIRLGFWQLDRMQQKEALLVQYRTALAMNSEAEWPADPARLDTVLFRHARLVCAAPGKDAPMAGHNARGETGWAHVFACPLANGGQARVVLGWSRDAAPRQWAGGEVGGVIAPGGRLIADAPLPGLAANARPDPRDVPNNHWSYAIQWFLFAATALVIYALALRKRLAV